MRQFLAPLRSAKSGSSEEAKKQRNSALGVVVSILFLMSIVGYVANIIAGFGLVVFVPSIVVGISALACVVTSFFKSGGILFSIKDWDLLMSLPVSKRVIVCAKLASLYVSALGIGLLLAIPGLGVYYSSVGITGPNLLFGIIVMLLVPVIPVAIGAFFSLIITWIGSHFRRINVATGVITLLGLLLATAVYYVFVRQTTQFGISMEQINAIADVFKPATWAVGAIVSEQASDLVSFASVTIVLGIVVVELVNFGFYPINIRFQQKLTKGDFKFNKASVSKASALKSLTKKEFQTLINTPSIIGNSLFGVIVALLISGTLLVLSLGGINGASLVMGFIMPSIDDSTVMSGVNIPGVYFGEWSMYIFLIWLVSVATANQAAACAMSLEGSNVWIMRTIPVDKKTIYLSKLMPSIIVYGSSYFVSACLFSFALKLDLIGTLSIFLILLSSSFFSTAVGFYMDCRKPNFSWKSSADVTKRGASVMWATYPLVGICFAAILVNIFFGEAIAMLLPVIMIAIGAFLLKKIFAQNI